MVTSQQLADSVLLALDRHPAKAGEIVDGLVAYAAQKNLSSYLPHVARHLKRVASERVRQEDVFVQVASQASKKLVKEIVSHVASDVEGSVHTSVDADIVGGFVVRHRDTVHDGSVRGMIERLELAMRAL